MSERIGGYQGIDDLSLRAGLGLEVLNEIMTVSAHPHTVVEEVITGVESDSQDMIDGTLPRFYPVRLIPALTRIDEGRATHERVIDAIISRCVLDIVDKAELWVIPGEEKVRCGGARLIDEIAVMQQQSIFEQVEVYPALWNVVGGEFREDNPCHARQFSVKAVILRVQLVILDQRGKIEQINLWIVVMLRIAIRPRAHIVRVRWIAHFPIDKQPPGNDAARPSL